MAMMMVVGLMGGVAAAENDESPRYGQGRNGGNYIADVANHMDDDARFDGISKYDKEAYTIAVAEFLLRGNFLCPFYHSLMMNDPADKVRVMEKAMEPPVRRLFIEGWPTASSIE